MLHTRHHVAIGFAAGSITAVAALGGRGAAVRLLRDLDQRGGFFTTRGFHAYAAIAAPAFGALHRRVAADAVTTARTWQTAQAPNISIVDIGSGPGDLVRQLSHRLPEAEITGVEPSAEMREIAASRGGRFVAGTAEQLPFADRSVDLVLSTLSSHHWVDVPAALREIDRILRPGGEARIYDARIVAYAGHELDERVAVSGIDPARVTTSIVPTRGIALFSVIRLSAGAA